MDALKRMSQKADSRRKKAKRRSMRRDRYLRLKDERSALRRERLKLYKQELTSAGFQSSSCDAADCLRDDTLPSYLQVPTEGEDYTDTEWTSESMDSWKDESVSAWPGGKVKKHPKKNRDRRDYEGARLERIGHEFHGFLHLPPEIRHIIYRMLLVRGTMFVPNLVPSSSVEAKLDRSVQRYVQAHNLYDFNEEPRRRYKGYKEPRPSKWDARRDAPLLYYPTCFGLLKGVSKRIQAEAEQVFWKNNRVVLPAGHWTSPVTLSGEDENPLPALPAPPATDLSVAFDMRDDDGYDNNVDKYERRYAAIQSFESGGVEAREVTPQQLRDKMHEQRSERLDDIWEARCLALLDVTTLKRLEIDFEDCFCGDGCCRLVDSVCEKLGPWKDGMAPACFRIMNWLNPAEERMIREKLVFLNAIDEHQVQFVPRAATDVHSWAFDGEFAPSEGEDEVDQDSDESEDGDGEDDDEGASEDADADEPRPDSEDE